MQRLRRLLAAREGAVAIEYALIAGIMVVAVLGGASHLGGKVETLFSDTSEGIVTELESDADE